MKKKLAIIATLTLAIVSCNQDNPYLIEKGKIGNLTKETQTSELEALYIADSLVKDSVSSSFNYVSQAKYKLYSKEDAKHLLTLTPTKLNDSTEVIENIRVFDERFETSKGITLKSTFGDIQDNYKISRVTNSINNVLVFVDEIDAYFVIDKMELPESLRYDVSLAIEAIQIPENAKVKYFMLGWQ